MMEQNGPTRDVLRRWVRRGETRITSDEEGQRLDRFLAERFTYRSRTQWSQIIREGRIVLNGRKVRPSRVLRDGDLIGYVPAPKPEPPIDRKIAILFVDDCLVAIAKTGNLPIHPSGGYFRHTLIHLLAETYPEYGSLRVIHRLDRETSGVVVFGRDREVTNRIAGQFRSRQVEKRYLALVEGSAPEPHFRIDRPLGPARDSLIRKAVGVREDGAPACTEIRLLHQGDGWAWVEARPLTGRLHQIRVHLKSVGLPILGDKVYGRSERIFLKFVAGEPLSEEEAAALALPRQALHAYRLTIRHPASGKLFTLTAPLPSDLAGALRSRGLDPAPWEMPCPPC